MQFLILVSHFLLTMQIIPADIQEKFLAVLKQRAVPLLRHADYMKWLRYFLDFRSKYPLPDSRSEQVRLFIQKLREKKQTNEQQKQAAHALSLYFESQPRIKSGSGKIEEKTSSPVLNDKRITASTPQFQEKEKRTVNGQRSGSRFNEWRCMEKSKSPEWDALIDRLAAEIKLRHYSRKTLKTYADWSRKFQSYLKNKRPDELSAMDVKDYLTYLAVNCKVAASTQNQAFNALLFLYRHILKKDFGDHKDIPRAKRSNYIPVVLSRQEIDAVVKHLRHPYDLFIKLLYGCGLRLFEGVKLRVKDFNFDAGILTVRGKGNKIRVVFLSKTAQQALAAYISQRQDMDPALFVQHIYNAAPGREIRLTPRSVQHMIKKYALLAGLTKKITPHTLRHSYATDLLSNGADVRQVQQLLGHASITTTQVYTHLTDVHLKDVHTRFHRSKKQE